MRNRIGRAAILAAVVMIAGWGASSGLGAQRGAPNTGEWIEYGGDKGATKYSPLTQIDRNSVGNLRIAWRRPGVADEYLAQHPGLTFSHNFRSTPVMAGGVLYASNGGGLVEAFAPATGRTTWVQDLPDGEPVGGEPSRGVALWRDGDDARIFAVRGRF